MAINKTQCGWMALGGMLCLFGAVLIGKIKEGNLASAQTDETGIPLVAPVPPEPQSRMEPIKTEEPREAKTAKKKHVPQSEPAAPLMQLGEPDQPLPPLQDSIKKDSARTSPDAPGLPAPTPIAPSTTLPDSPSIESPTRSPQGNVLAVPPPAPPTPAPPIPQPIMQAPYRIPAVSGAPISRADYRTEGEPPLAPRPGLIQVYHVKHEGETPRDIARRTLGSGERCEDVIKLNPNLKSDGALPEGTVVRLPADACIPVEEVETVKPLPVLRKPNQSKTRALPLTGTFPCNLDDKHTLILPRAIRDQFGNCDTVLLTPGPDHCLWVTNHAHLERLAERLENSPAREPEVRVFRRLYYAQTEKASIGADGRVQVPEKLIQFAGLHQEVVLVGIDDHFELWDVAQWKQYTQQKSAAARGVVADEE